MVLNPHLIWPSIPFVCLIFCHCPKAKSSLGQWSCLVLGTVSFPGHLYAHIRWHITNNKSCAASGSIFYCQFHSSCGGWESRVVQEQGYSHHLKVSEIESCPGSLAEPSGSLPLYGAAMRTVNSEDCVARSCLGYDCHCSSNKMSAHSVCAGNGC